VLGPPRVTAAGKDISGDLRKARELLAHLATFPGGASADAISEALWPGSSSPAAATSQRNLAMLRRSGATGAPSWRQVDLVALLSHPRTRILADAPEPKAAVPRHSATWARMRMMS